MPPLFGHRPNARKRRNRRMADAAPTRGADERTDLDERGRDVLPAAVRTAVVGSDAYRRMVSHCPEPFRGWLSGVIEDLIETRGQEVYDLAGGGHPVGREWWCDEDSEWPTARFLGEVRRMGFQRAVLANAGVVSDADARGGEECYLPDSGVVFPLIRHVLTCPADPADYKLRWSRVQAARTVVQYAPTEREAVEVFAVCLGDPDVGHHAVVQLADLAPRTPGLVERLLDAMTEPWNTDTHHRYNDNGADAAVEALNHLWQTAVREPAPLPLLVRAVRGFAGRRADALLGVWEGLGQQAADDFPEPDWAGLDEGWAAFNVWYALPDRVTSRRRVLARLLADGHVAWHAYQEIGLTPLAVVLDFDLPAELSLPAVAGILAVCRDHEDREYVHTAFEQYLTRLPARRERWSDGDAWLATLGGRSFGDLAWAVYADWVEERGHADAAHQIRVLHAEPIDPADVWGEVYRFISTFTPPPAEV